MTPAFTAYDRRNRKTYLVNSISWSYGSILRRYHKGVPDDPWLPEEIVVTLQNGRRRLFSYTPRTVRGMTGRRIVTRDIRDLELRPITEDELRGIVP